MSPLDRIAQLNAEVGTLTRENAMLRSQLHDAQEQAKRDSETIARLAKEKAMIDFLESEFGEVYEIHGEWYVSVTMGEFHHRTLRGAISAAQRELPHHA